MRWLHAIGLASALLGSVGCVSRAEPSRCEAMAAHVVALTRAAHAGRAAEIANEVASERRQDLVERCVAEGTVAEVECVLAAESLDAIQACAP